ncbi:transmembrane protein, putative [Medicago truncatula]|uniref:Transmembrane protein, putative n=1 Tax=Medicago truncatula TaxID=3880 RepID=A0A072U327_MEDTR|nr:transmembrane protein, putative [Medicago truncatula]
MKVVMTWWFCSGVDNAVLVDRWREETDLWWCGGGSAVWWGVWWWLMGGSVGFIGFRGGGCWFLVGITGGFLEVNGGSFGGVGYTFCGFSSRSFVVDEVFKYMDVS